jgi:hypothetical protein
MVIALTQIHSIGRRNLSLKNMVNLREIVEGWEEMLRRLDQDWEVVDELEKNRFLMEKKANLQTF